MKEIGLAYACQAAQERVIHPSCGKPRLSSDLTAFTRLCPLPFCFQLASFQPERFALLTGQDAVVNVGGT